MSMVVNSGPSSQKSSQNMSAVRSLGFQPQMPYNPAFANIAALMAHQQMGQNRPEFSNLLSAMSNPFLMMSQNQYRPNRADLLQPFSAPNTLPISPSSSSSSSSSSISSKSSNIHCNSMSPNLAKLSSNPSSNSEKDLSDQDYKVELIDKDLWDQFYRNGTEMVITKSGR